MPGIKGEILNCRELLASASAWCQMSRERCVFFISGAPTTVTSPRAPYVPPFWSALAPTLFTFTSEPTACEILFLRQSEMRLAVNWVYDGIKYACRLPRWLTATFTVHRVRKFCIRSFIFTTFSLLKLLLITPIHYSGNPLLYFIWIVDVISIFLLRYG